MLSPNRRYIVYASVAHSPLQATPRAPAARSEPSPSRHPFSAPAGQGASCSLRYRLLRFTRVHCPKRLAWRPRSQSPAIKRSIITTRQLAVSEALQVVAKRPAPPNDEPQAVAAIQQTRLWSGKPPIAPSSYCHCAGRWSGTCRACGDSIVTACTPAATADSHSYQGTLSHPVRKVKQRINYQISYSRLLGFREPILWATAKGRDLVAARAMACTT